MTAAGEPWTWEELFRGLVATESFVEELERLGLLRVVGRDASGRPIYDAEARETLEKVMALVEAGYDPRDIAVIANKVGLKRPRARGRRKRRHAPTFVKLDELASRAGVEDPVVESWVDAGVVEPGLVTEGGERLFAKRVVDDVRACDDLLALGLVEDDIALWREIGGRLRAAEAGGGELEQLETDATGFVARVKGAIKRRKKASRRWNKRLGRLAKRLDKARKRSARQLAGRRRSD